MKIKPIISKSLLYISIGILVASCATDSEDTPSPTDSRDKYIGTWSCAENSSQSGASTFDVTLRKNTNDENQLLIDNFYLLGNTHSASMIVSGTSLSLPVQSVSARTVQGSGSIASATKMNLTYSVNDGAGTDNCTAVITKK